MNYFPASEVKESTTCSSEFKGNSATFFKKVRLRNAFHMHFAPEQPGAMLTNHIYLTHGFNSEKGKRVQKLIL